MIGVAVTDDQRIGQGRIELHHRVVVEEGPLGERKVEQDLAPLASARRLEVVREPMLGGRRRDADAAAYALDRDRVELSALREHVVDVVHHVGHDEPIDDGRRRASARTQVRTRCGIGWLTRIQIINPFRFIGSEWD